MCAFILQCIEKICSINKAGGFSVASGVAELKGNNSSMPMREVKTRSSSNGYHPSPSSSTLAIGSGTNRQAGAILNSSLVYAGWHLPEFMLTDADDRFLFDLEVKLKLTHPSAIEDIWNSLKDFPSQALVLKTGIIGCVLDRVGATMSSVDLG